MDKAMRKIFFVAFLLLGVRLVAAVGGTLGAAGDWSMRRVSSADGLPSNKVNDIAQDSLGFVWMATGNGLFRIAICAVLHSEGASGAVRYGFFAFPFPISLLSAELNSGANLSPFCILSDAG